MKTKGGGLGPEDEHRVPIWEESVHTPVVFVRVAIKGLTGYGKRKSAQDRQTKGVTHAHFAAQRSFHSSERNRQSIAVCSRNKIWNVRVTCRCLGKEVHKNKKAAAWLPHSIKGRKNIWANYTSPLADIQGKLFDDAYSIEKGRVRAWPNLLFRPGARVVPTVSNTRRSPRVAGESGRPAGGLFKARLNTVE